MKYIIVFCDSFNLYLNLKSLDDSKAKDEQDTTFSSWLNADQSTTNELSRKGCVRGRGRERERERARRRLKPNISIQRIRGDRTGDGECTKITSKAVFFTKADFKR